MSQLEGRAGIVTAARSGMGRAGAIKFARERAKVAVVDRDEKTASAVTAETVEAGGTAIANEGGTSDYD